MTLVAGVDSSTQSCKVVVRDLETGALLRIGRATHPDGTEVDPAAWWSALQEALSAAGGLDDVAAISIGGQQITSIITASSAREMNLKAGQTAAALIKATEVMILRM